MAAKAGWRVVGADVRSYFRGTSAVERLVVRGERLLPPSQRDGITMLLERPA